MQANKRKREDNKRVKAEDFLLGQSTTTSTKTTPSKKPKKDTTAESKDKGQKGEPSPTHKKLSLF
jgi:hypothetical protein